MSSIPLEKNGKPVVTMPGKYGGRLLRGSNWGHDGRNAGERPSELKRASRQGYRAVLTLVQAYVERVENWIMDIGRDRSSCHPRAEVSIEI